MDITFTKTANRNYEILIRRDDGVTLELRTFDRPAGLPHDIAHFIVESELHLERGLWGLLAAGVLFGIVRVTSGRLRPRALEQSRELEKKAGQHSIEAPVLVAVVLSIAEDGLDSDWRKVSFRLKDAWQPRRSQRGPITHDEVRRACHRLREAEHQWEELPLGGSMNVKWAT